MLSSCVLAAAPLRLRGRGVSASDGSESQLSLLLHQLGVEPCAPCVLPIITITFVFVLFCFVLFCYFFTFLFFPGTQLGHYIPASRHN